MPATTAWSEEVYRSSVTSRCWAYTPYEQGWAGCSELRSDAAVRQLVQQELALAPVPGWAQETVERSINYPPFCPHWAFPAPYLEVLDAIGRQAPPAFVHGCYTADRERKGRMQDYVLCLDAWLAGVDPRATARELSARGARRVDWQQVCGAVWDVLGARTELKELLVRRIVHRQRRWIKSLVWDDDRRDVFCRDQYQGDVHAVPAGYGHYGNPGFLDPCYPRGVHARNDSIKNALRGPVIHMAGERPKLRAHPSEMGAFVFWGG